jgi:hypothetical protein
MMDDDKEMTITKRGEDDDDKDIDKGSGWQTHATT